MERSSFRQSKGLSNKSYKALSKTLVYAFIVNLIQFLSIYIPKFLQDRGEMDTWNVCGK